MLFAFIISVASMFIANGNLVVWITALLGIYLYFQWKSSYWKRQGVPGPKSYPFIGTLWEHLFHANNVLELKRYQTFGKVYGAMQGWIPVITIGEPELIKQIRIADFRSFRNHREMYPKGSLMNKNLVDLKDGEWKRVRNIVSPVFSTGKIKAMQPMIQICIRNTLLYIEEVANDQLEVDIKRVMMLYTVDTIALCAFAMETNAYKNPKDDFLLKANDFSTIRVWRLITSLVLPSKLQIHLNLGLVDQNVIDYFKNVLQMVLKERRKNQLEKRDFVQLLLNAELDSGYLHQDARKKLTDEEIMAQSLLFFLAGFETTSTLLQFTLYALAMNTKVQQKLFDEIRNCYNESHSFEYESIMSLPYLDAVMNETLRMYTPIPNFEHVCNEKYKLGDTGITIEKGTVVNLPYYAMLHDSELFPEPNVFNPERFLPDNRDDIKPFSFTPFGTGPRMCIGQRFATFNSKLFLANLVIQYEVLITENTAPEPEFDGTFVFLSCKPLMVMFRKRVAE